MTATLTRNSCRIPRVVVAVFLPLAALVGSVQDWFRVCEETVSVVQGKAVTYCHPPTIDDLSVMSGILLVALLVSPELGEFAIPGLISLKRRVEENAERIQRGEQRVESLAMQFLAIENRVAVHSGATANIQITTEALATLHDDLRRTIDSMPELEPISDPRPDVATPYVSEETEMAILAARFLKVTESLDRFVPGLGAKGSETYVNSWQRSFCDAFDRQLAVVQVLRSAIFHARPLEAEQIRQGVAIAQELVSIANEWSVRKE